MSDGGRIQFGWAIWEWPGVYLEAEHHAVYEPSNGTPWIDITPSGTPEITHRLFLPDDTARYDFENEGVRRDNLREALADDELIQQFFRIAEQKSAIFNSIPGVGEIVVDLSTAMKLERVEDQQKTLMYVLAMKYTRRNERCFCGSGKKFKKCHGEKSTGNDQLTGSYHG